MRHFALFALVLGLVACRGDSGGGDDTTTPDGSTTGDVKIQDIQNDSMPGCDATTPEGCVELKLKGVVVTAIDAFGMRTGQDFWVQEPEGGPYSGIQVFGASVDQLAALQVGDIVDIAGAQKKEFVYTNPDNDSKSLGLTELEPFMGGQLTVTKVMSGTPLEPTVVDALAIGQLPDYMARHAEWEKWEGVLVKVNNVQAFSDAECIKSKGKCPDPTYQGFDLTGDAVVQSSLTAMPSPVPAFGDCFTSVTGVVGSFYDYYIMPRTAEEFGTGGTSCPTENEAATCTDNIDNDGNGFKDCADNDCILADATCHPSTTISAIQTAATPSTGGIELQNVYVAAVSKNKKNMWVQTSLAAAPNEGIYVYGTGANLNYAVGSTVNVIGTVAEFNDMDGTETLTQVKAIKIEAGTGTAGTIEPVSGVEASALGETYESVLVTLSNVTVSTLGVPCPQGTMPPACNYGLGAITDAPSSTPVKTDDDINVLGPANTCYASVTGIWTYLVYEETFGFYPLTTTGTGTCN